jgi:hypothetical protein
MNIPGYSFSELGRKVPAAGNIAALDFQLFWHGHFKSSLGRLPVRCKPGFMTDLDTIVTWRVQACRDQRLHSQQRIDAGTPLLADDNLPRHLPMAQRPVPGAAAMGGAEAILGNSVDYADSGRAVAAVSGGVGCPDQPTPVPDRRRRSHPPQHAPHRQSGAGRRRSITDAASTRRSGWAAVVVFGTSCVEVRDDRPQVYGANRSGATVSQGVHDRF